MNFEPPQDLAALEPSDADWYANLLWLDRRKRLLLAHAGTLFSVFVADVHRADLSPLGSLVVRIIQRELRTEGLPLDTLGNLDLNAVELAKTAQPECAGLHERNRTLLRGRDNRGWRAGSLRY